MVSAGRAALSGVLVGCGAAMGNGCTSGHGICGNARLSPRSMAYTGVFMAVGCMAATLGEDVHSHAFRFCLSSLHSSDAHLVWFRIAAKDTPILVPQVKALLERKKILKRTSISL